MASKLSWEPSQQLIYSPATTEVGPCFAVYNGVLFATWRGSGGDEHIYYSTYDGRFWSPQAGIREGQSTVGASLATYKGQLWAVCRGRSGPGNERLWFTHHNGREWAEWRATDLWTSTGASLSMFRGDLYAVGKGEKGDDKMWYANFDGATWTRIGNIPAPAQTSARPATAVMNVQGSQKLVAAWKGPYDEENLWYSTFDGTVWTPQQPIPNAKSSDAPSLTTLNGKIYAAWKGPDEDEKIWLATFDGQTWSPPTIIPSQFGGSFAPSLVVFHDQLYAAWKGRTGDSRIWWTRASVSTPHEIPPPREPSPLPPPQAPHIENLHLHDSPPVNPLPPTSSASGQPILPAAPATAGLVQPTPSPYGHSAQPSLSAPSAPGAPPEMTPSPYGHSVQPHVSSPPASEPPSAPKTSPSPYGHSPPPTLSGGPAPAPPSSPPTHVPVLTASPAIPDPVVTQPVAAAPSASQPAAAPQSGASPPSQSVSPLPAAHVPQQPTQSNPFKRDFGLSDIKKGLQLGVEQGKAEFSERWTKFNKKK